MAVSDGWMETGSHALMIQWLHLDTQTGQADR